jgi:polyribonucleotide nucleotidyltransferase
MSPYAPKITSFVIDPDKIRDVIGSGGKVINKIIEETGVKIDISDDGKVFIAATDSAAAERAMSIINAIVFEPAIDDEFDGTVARILAFGAFVEYAPGRDGMIHISKLSNKRVEKVEDVVNIGDRVRVKCIKIDEKGRVDFKLVKKY